MRSHHPQILKHGGTLASDFSVQSRITLTHIVGAPTAGERGNERDVADWAAELFPREPRAQLSVTALRAREEVPRQTFVHAAWIYDCVQVRILQGACSGSGLTRPAALRAQRGPPRDDEVPRAIPIGVMYH